MNIKDNIIYENSNIIICHKMAGQLSQSDRSFDVDMVSALKSYRSAKKEEPYIAIINRLDRPVSGLVLFAKNKNAAAKYSEYLKNEGINKYYYAVINGKMDKDNGILEDYLVKDGKTNTSKTTTKAEGKLSRLEYEVIDTQIEGEREYSLVRIHLLTGRHHQIRVQFATRGHSLLGDTKYGSADNNVNMKNAIALCAYKLEIDGKEYEIKPEGAGFDRFLNKLGE